MIPSNNYYLNTYCISFENVGRRGNVTDSLILNFWQVADNYNKGVRIVPTTIPFNASLVLGNIIPAGVLPALEAIGVAQSAIDAAEDNLNSMISLKRSLQMTMQELDEMGVPTTAVQTALATVNTNVATAAAGYATTSVAQSTAIQTQRAGMPQITEAPESPIDYNRTQIKRMPLSADSLRMNVQYFSFDENEQSAANFISQIGGFVSDSVSVLSNSWASQASGEVKNQTSSQVENHDIVGTLVVAITCTHKDAVLLAPFVLDPDKAVRVWNQVFTDPSDQLNTDNLPSFLNQPDDPKKALNIISGATYGSSFVGMVHVLRTESTQSSQSMSSVAASMQEQFDVACLFEHAQGGFGMDASFSSDFKNLLSTQNITSHVSLTVMGVIPSIKSNQVALSVKTFAAFDPDEMMGKLATLANSTESDHQSVTQAAAAARTGGTMVALEQAKIASVMSGLSATDDKSNQILDINSMMTALEDYVGKAIAGDCGVPINYYVKPITKLQIAEGWVSRYLPGKYIAPTGDDTPGSPPAATPTTPPVTPPADNPPADTPTG
jgi:hypothetical protein